MSREALEIEELIGAPYSEAGASPEAGFSCLGLVRHLYRERLGVELPADYLRFIERFHQVEHPEPWDLVAACTLTGARGVVTHLGVYLGGHRFLHSLEGTGVAVSRCHVPPWNKRIACFLRLNARGAPSGVPPGDPGRSA